MGWLAKLWERLLDWLAPEVAPDFTPPRITVELPAFNWLADYGPHWKPDSTAFWLEPRKEEDLIAWLRKYRPEFQGEFSAAGLSVTVTPTMPDVDPLLGLIGSYHPDWIYPARMQQQAYSQYRNSLMSQQGLLGNAYGRQNAWSSLLGGLFGGII